jgi:hypothetical protein
MNKLMMAEFGKRGWEEQRRWSTESGRCSIRPAVPKADNRPKAKLGSYRRRDRSAAVQTASASIRLAGAGIVKCIIAKQLSALKCPEVKTSLSLGT